MVLTLPITEGFEACTLDTIGTSSHIGDSSSCCVGYVDATSRATAKRISERAAYRGRFGLEIIARCPAKTYYLGNDPSDFYFPAVRRLSLRTAIMFKNIASGYHTTIRHVSGPTFSDDVRMTVRYNNNEIWVRNFGTSELKTKSLVDDVWYTMELDTDYVAGWVRSYIGGELQCEMTGDYSAQPSLTQINVGLALYGGQFPALGMVYLDEIIAQEGGYIGLPAEKSPYRLNPKL